MFKPIQLDKVCQFVARDSMLFCTCQGCDKMLTWIPQGGARFYATHCDWTYEANPIDINLRQFAVEARKYEAGNVKQFKKKEKDKMVFA